jgi:alpha-L-fucosidase 2
MKNSFLFLLLAGVLSCTSQNEKPQTGLLLKYDRPAQSWNEALPVGNGRLGAMVFGGVVRERIQFNEETLWTGEPHDYAHPGASEYLDTIRQLLFAGKPREAERIAMEHTMSIPLGQKAYQPFGDLYIDFPGHENYSAYRRTLDISQALSTVSYKLNNLTYTREVFASHPDQVIVVRLTGNQMKKLSFNLGFDSPHENKTITTDGTRQTLTVAVKDGALHGMAGLMLDTDGMIGDSAGMITVREAGTATIYLSAATNFVNFRDVSGDPAKRMDDYFAAIRGKSYKQLRRAHIADYQSLFNRFDINFGSNGRDSLPMDQRLRLFNQSPEDPGLIGLYVQYGRYLMISSSRPGTMPANLQGIWNQDLEPAWDSKYTTNINAEMNYWPVEVANLSECHEPFFKMIEECAQTGA